MPSAPSSVSSSPPSLRGITSTNDDPYACAHCSNPFSVDVDRKTRGMTKICCGKCVCCDCSDPDSLLTVIGAGRAQRCSFCNSPAIVGNKEKVGILKKHAKKGTAWAQQQLAACYDSGVYVSQSDHYEAKRWFEKAAKQGHPDAMCRLAFFFLEGRGGCSIDLSKAREYAEMAMSLDSPIVAGHCHNLLFEIARRENDRSSAKAGLVSAALQGVELAPRNILVCCKDLLDMPEAHFWLDIVFRSDKKQDDPDLQKSVDDISSNLRKLRDSCGGCGAALVGDRRLYCKQCRTYCYCSRDCQKLHWNRTGEGGHRSECMGVKLLKDRMAC